MHTYSVALMIAGDDLDQAEVSTKLGLQPLVFLNKGEPLSPKRRRERSVWSCDVRPSPDDPEWQLLDDGLKSLVEKLLPLKNDLRELRQRYSTEAYCGHFGTGFGGGPSISAETLRLLADLGLTLTIKTYWGDNQPDEDAKADERDHREFPS
jgi:Domain of unknown function (DUF4279)